MTDRRTPDFAVETLGPCVVGSPLAPRLEQRGTTQHTVEETDRVLFDDTLAKVARRAGGPGALRDLPSLEPTGPRKCIFFDPAKTRVGIVTCGIRRIYGFENGYRGFVPSYGHDVVGRWRRRFVHIPIALAVCARNQVDPHGDLWWSVLEATGQPLLTAGAPAGARAQVYSPQ